MLWHENEKAAVICPRWVSFWTVCSRVFACDPCGYFGTLVLGAGPCDWNCQWRCRRVEGREGLASAAASLVTLSTGGSTGREGPAVHIAAMISSKVCEWVNARGITARDLLGCATGAAVAASFNAPIAGALFALEVILRHFAPHAFAPIVIASVAGAVVYQMAFGDQVEFNLPFAPDL